METSLRDAGAIIDHVYRLPDTNANHLAGQARYEVGTGNWWACPR